MFKWFLHITSLFHKNAEGNVQPKSKFKFCLVLFIRYTSTFICQIGQHLSLKFVESTMLANLPSALTVPTCQLSLQMHIFVSICFECHVLGSHDQNPQVKPRSCKFWFDCITPHVTLSTKHQTESNLDRKITAIYAIWNAIVLRH